MYICMYVYACMYSCLVIYMYTLMHKCINCILLMFVTRGGPSGMYVCVCECMCAPAGMYLNKYMRTVCFSEYMYVYAGVSNHVCMQKFL